MDFAKIALVIREQSQAPNFADELRSPLGDIYPSPGIIKISSAQRESPLNHAIVVTLFG